MASGTRRGAPAREPAPYDPELEEVKLQHARRARMNLDPEDAPRLFIKTFYGTDLDTLDDFVAFVLKHPLTDSIAKAAGYFAFMGGWAMAMRGDVRAIELMIKYSTGAPDRGYLGHVNEMTMESLIDEINTISKEMDASPEFTERLLARSRQKRSG